MKIYIVWVMIILVLILGFYGREKAPCGSLYAPCDVLQCFICTLQSFSTLYLCLVTLSYIWFFRKFGNYLLVNSQKSVSHSFDYSRIQRSFKFLIVNFYKTSICWFRIFGFPDLMVISNKISIHSIIKLS